MPSALLCLSKSIVIKLACIGGAMAQKGVSSFLQAPGKLSSGIVRASALSSSDAKLLGSSDSRLLKNSVALNASNVTCNPFVGSGTDGFLGGEGLIMQKQKVHLSDLAPSLAKRARTSEAGPIRAQGDGSESQSWDQINAEATTSGRPPLSQKYKRRIVSESFEEVQDIDEEDNGENVQVGPRGEETRGEGVLSEEQKLRIKANKAAAMAKLAQRRAEDVVAAAHARGEALPPLADLFLDQSWREALPGEFQKAFWANLEKFVGQEVVGKVPIYPPQASIFRAFNTCPFERVKVVILGQGVLLLNTVLTVRQGQANSHAKRGWELFTDAAIRALSKQRKGVVFLLWGRPAQEKVRLIDASSHHILKCAHPSGLSAHRGFFGCKHFSQANKILEEAGKLPVDWQL